MLIVLMNKFLTVCTVVWEVGASRFLLLNISFSRKEVAELLLDRGADPTVKDKYGETALMKASRGGHKEVAELLLDRESKSWKAETAVMIAIEQGRKGIVDLLERYGKSETVAES